MMKNLNLGQVVGILANVGVIAGIALLAVQINQTNQLMPANARYNRLAAVLESYTIQATDPDIAAILIKDRHGEELTELEEFRIQAFWTRVLRVVEWVYLELPEAEAWAPGQRRNYSVYSSYRRAWRGESGGPQASGMDLLDPRFVEFFEEHVAVE